MINDEAAGERLLLELRARDAWNERDYEGAQRFAEELAHATQRIGDDLGWWNATFLVSECLRKQGRVRDSRQVAETLSRSPLTLESEALRARVSILLSLALQGSGELAQAVSAARDAVTHAVGNPGDISVEVDARNVLVASLADSDQLEAAWDECHALDDLLRLQPGSRYRGQSYWAIGNVAFLLMHIEDGVAYHQLAAANLSPINDLDLWARFNRGSAQFRLAAGVVEPETLECIERAELANSIVGGTERDHEELKLTRAHWLVLTDQFEASADLLRSVVANKDLVASHTAAQAHFLLGQALSGLGNKAGATTNLELSEELFLQSGAEDRAAAARGLIESLRHSE